MATLRNIKRRISSVRSTQQITKAMKMVAAAKLRKAQNRLIRTRPYAKELGQVLAHIVERSKKAEKLHPLLVSHKLENVCYVLVTADRGLCGGFNSNLIKRANQELAALDNTSNLRFITIGRKGYEYFKRRDHEIFKHWIDLFNDLQFVQAQQIANELTTLYLKRKVDRIFVIYSQFKSAVQQKLIVEQLLPIQPEPVEEERFPVKFVYDPSPYMILKRLCPLNINFQMWRILLESSASEFGARMTAMEAATDNAEEMIEELTLFYNKARQATITKEISEIVAGAEALRKG